VLSFNAHDFGALNGQVLQLHDNNYLYCNALEVELRENVKFHSSNPYHLAIFEQFYFNLGMVSSISTLPIMFLKCHSTTIKN
jgi:hypothetical protein